MYRYKLLDVIDCGSPFTNVQWISYEFQPDVNRTRNL